MSTRLVLNIIRFFVLIFAQVIIFNHIQFSGFLNPYIYVLYILLMPFETPKGIMLITSFFLGLVIDLFSHTLGMHAMACVFMAFMRPTVLNWLSPRDGYESTSTLPRIYYMGLAWFIQFAFLLILFHHLVLFFAEAFTLLNFFLTFWRVIASTLFSLLFIILSQYFIFQK